MTTHFSPRRTNFLAALRYYGWQPRRMFSPRIHSCCKGAGFGSRMDRFFLGHAGCREQRSISDGLCGHSFGRAAEQRGAKEATARRAFPLYGACRRFFPRACRCLARRRVRCAAIVVSPCARRGAPNAIIAARAVIGCAHNAPCDPPAASRRERAGVSSTRSAQPAP